MTIKFNINGKGKGKAVTSAPPAKPPEKSVNEISFDDMCGEQILDTLGCSKALIEYLDTQQYETSIEKVGSEYKVTIYDEVDDVGVTIHKGAMLGLLYGKADKTYVDHIVSCLTEVELDYPGHMEGKTPYKWNEDEMSDKPKSAMEMLGVPKGATVTKAPNAPTPDLKKSVSDLMNEIKKSDPKPTIEAPQNLGSMSFDVYPIDEIKTGPTIPLAQATMIYQPVKGTSPGSRYYLIAANPKIKVAIKGLKESGTGLSVRVEGPGLATFKEIIQDLGFTFNGDYASMHLQPGTQALRSKTIGSILLALDMPWDTPVPFLKVLTK